MADQKTMQSIDKAVMDFEKAVHKDLPKMMQLSDKIRDEKMANVKKTMVQELAAMSAPIKKAAKALEGAIAKIGKDVHKDDKSVSNHLNVVVRHLNQIMPGRCSLQVSAKAKGNTISVAVK